MAVAAATVPVQASAQDSGACSLAPAGRVVDDGDVAQRLELSMDALRAMPRTVAQASFHGGPVVTHEGVTLRELLTRAGVPDPLGSGDLTRYVVVEAADGYRALFAMAELDPAFTDAPAFLADRQDGGAIPDEYGPFQVYVPGEKRHARAVRNVRCIRVERDGAGR